MNEHEEKTISTFIIREKRHRFRYFMDNPKLRPGGLNCLNRTEVLVPRYVTWLSKDVDVYKLLQQEGCPENVYCISTDDDRLDGKTLPLEEALALLYHDGWVTILSCIPGKLAYYHGELNYRRALLKA